MACIAGAKYNMLADVLKPEGSPVTSSGHWTYSQDPVSGDVIRVWVDDDPNTPDVEGHVVKGVPCTVRGVMNAALTGAGTTQKFEEIYKNIEWVKMEYPTSYVITQRDRVIRVRDSKGNIIWKEEELDQMPSTTFEVMGVTPVVGPFGTAVSNYALLKRTSVQ